MTGPDIRTPIRVHVVDNEQIVCDYFVECLGAQPGIVVTGTSLNAAGWWPRFPARRPMSF